MVHSLPDLASAVLLSGSIRPSPFETALGRSTGDLPLTSEHSIREAWHVELRGLAETASWPRLPVRVVVGHQAWPPAEMPACDRAPATMERDPLEFRGPAGVLADIAREYPADSYLLVASGSQILTSSLLSLFESLVQSASDISLIAQEDGTPATLMLIRCRCLEDVPRVGFVDFKEQSLPRLAERYHVQVVQLEEPCLFPVFNREDYLSALRRYHTVRPENPVPSSLGRFYESWQPCFGLVERGATVHGSVDLFDSVVLRNAVVEEDAVIARSIIGEGAHVRARETVMDRLVSNEG